MIFLEKIPSWLKIVFVIVGFSIALSLVLSSVLNKVFPSVKNTQTPQRTEVFTACTQSPVVNRIYFGGIEADYISLEDGSNLQKIWDKPNESGMARGILSPDKSKLAYMDTHDDAIWIKCTANNGQYRIPFDKKIVAGLPESISTTNGVSWSPDSIYIAFNFGGDLIKVNTDTKEKIVIYPNMALKDFWTDQTKPRPSGWEEQVTWWQTGRVYWAKDKSLYYTKFIDGNLVELRRLDALGNDTLVLTNPYPLHVAYQTDDQKLLIYQTGWAGPNASADYNLQFVLNLKTGQKEYTLYNQNIYEFQGFGYNTFSTSVDKRYLLININHARRSSPPPTLQIIDLATNQEIDVQDKIRTYLKQNLLTDSSELIYSFDISKDNKLLYFVNFNSRKKQDLTLTSDIKGDNIKLISKGSPNLFYRLFMHIRSKPVDLMPEAWL